MLCSLRLRFNGTGRSAVTSLIALQFRERKSPDEARQHWDFWHGRQTSSSNARLLDVDARACEGLADPGPRDMANNAVAVRWRAEAGHGAKVSMALRCLSTDFTAQKGVKGIPLHIQVSLLLILIDQT